MGGDGKRGRCEGQWRQEVLVNRQIDVGLCQLGEGSDGQAWVSDPAQTDHRGTGGSATSCCNVLISSSFSLQLQVFGNPLFLKFAL